MACKHCLKIRRYEQVPELLMIGETTELTAFDYTYWQLSDRDRSIAEKTKLYGPCTEVCEQLMQAHRDCERVDSFMEAPEDGYK